MRRHFTVTGFVVDGPRTLLHWHKRLDQWMPPGGHIEPDEDPVQAVLREIREETGLMAEVIRTGAGPLPFGYPEQLTPPYTVLVEDIPGPDEQHKHIDFIYFCRPLPGEPHPVDDPSLRWVGEEELREAVALAVPGRGISAAVAEDVRMLALVAIETGRGPL